MIFDRPRWQLLAGSALVLLLLFLALIWGHIGLSYFRMAFACGLFSAFFLAIVLQFWHFYANNPHMSYQKDCITDLNRSRYRLIAVLMALASTYFVIGGLWVEWHITYGVAYGDGLYLHIMLYAAVLIILVNGATIWWFLFFKLRGVTLSQRFALEPGLGLLLLLTQFVVASLLVDPVWNLVVASTLTPFSIPHPLIFISTPVICGMALFSERIASGSRKWGFAILKFRDYLNLFVFASLFLLITRLLDRYDVRTSNLMQQADWAFPACSTLMAVAISTWGMRVLRFPFATTIAGFWALVAQNVLLSLSGYANAGSSVIVVVLGPVFIMDLYHAYRRGKESALGLGIVSAVALFLQFPIYDEWFGYTFTNTTYLIFVLISIPFSASIACLLNRLLDYMDSVTNMYADSQAQTLSVNRIFRHLPLLLFLANALFVVWVTTAL